MYTSKQGGAGGLLGVHCGWSVKHFGGLMGRLRPDHKRPCRIASGGPVRLSLGVNREEVPLGPRVIDWEGGRGGGQETNLGAVAAGV